MQLAWSILVMQYVFITIIVDSYCVEMPLYFILIDTCAILCLHIDNQWNLHSFSPI